jgi:hypothetical protein
VRTTVSLVPCSDGTIFNPELMQNGLTFGADDLLTLPESVIAAYVPAL